MDKFLYLAVAAGDVLLAATVVFILKKRCKDTGLVGAGEIISCGVLGLLLYHSAKRIPKLK